MVFRVGDSAVTEGELPRLQRYEELKATHSGEPGTGWMKEKKDST
jgi:hypothetical protein